MRIKNEFIAAAQAAILAALPIGQAREWHQITDAIRASGLEVKNWLHVRCVLQMLMDAGQIVRSPDVHIEQYTRTK